MDMVFDWGKFAGFFGLFTVPTVIPTVDWVDLSRPICIKKFNRQFRFTQQISIYLIILCPVYIARL